MSDSVNTYAGFTLPPKSAGFSLDSVPAEQVGTRAFWEAYIVPRKPCKIVGTLPGFQGKKWSNQ